MMNISLKPIKYTLIVECDELQAMKEQSRLIAIKFYAHQSVKWIQAQIHDRYLTFADLPFIMQWETNSTVDTGRGFCAPQREGIFTYILFLLIWLLL